LTENEIKKEYLNEYKNLCFKLKSLEEQLQSIREVNEAAKVQTLTDMPKGSMQTDLSDYMCKIEKLQDKIREKKTECENRRLDIEERILEVKNGIESTILFKKYIEFNKWEEICVDIGYEWAQVHRYHSKALQHFVL
jgi:hypothetical protein